VKAPPAESSGPGPVTVKMPAELHRWVKVRAVQTDRTSSAVVIEALELLRAVVEGEAGPA